MTWSTRLIGLFVLGLAAESSAALPPMSREDIICRAQSGVGYSYWWGGSCWCKKGCSPDFAKCPTGKCTPKAGSSGCPNCTHSGSYGADCSGFTYVCWRIEGLSEDDVCGSHGPVSGTYTSTTSNWTAIPAASRDKGDAIAKSGHVMVFEKNTTWGDVWVYEAKGCNYGIVHNAKAIAFGNPWKVSRRNGLVTGPEDPDIAISVASAAPSGQAADFRPEGTSKGVLDLFEGQTFEMSVVVTNQAGAKKTPDGVVVGYWFEQPWLVPTQYTIYSDWPAKDGKTFKVNDANSAPENPANNAPPKSGKLQLYVMSPGETKKIVFTVKATQYSIGAVDHPDLRAWIWHVGGYYGEQTSWNDPVEHNDAGKLLRAYSQADVYSKVKWEFNASEPETEGWQKGNSVDSIKNNESAHCLAAHMTGGDPQLLGPTTSFDAGAYKGIRLRNRSHSGAVEARLYFKTQASGSFTEDKAKSLVLPGDGEFHDLELSMADVPSWKGTITQLRLDPAGSASKTWTDFDWIRVVANVNGTSGDGDKDGFLAGPAGQDCDDKNAGIHPNANETCNGKDDDCDGQLDEGLGKISCGSGGCAQELPACTNGKPTVCPEIQVSEEVCDGVDNDCDGVVPPDEQDKDDDGALPCKGDCDDNDATVFPGAEELCDGADNDCDGQTDDGLDVGSKCTEGTGACEAPGVRQCTGDGQVVCNAAALPAGAEVCNGVDDDCDGDTDEDFGLGGPCTEAMGDCTLQGTMVCNADGSETYCKTAPDAGAERCNGEDDDCDGEIDEGLPVGEACTVGEGECAQSGVFACSDDGVAVCSAVPSPPKAELCNGVDDDCDGDIDDGYPIGGPCKASTGGCVAEGSWACDEGGLQVICVAADGACSDTSKSPGLAGTDIGLGAHDSLAGEESSGCAARRGGQPLALGLFGLLVLVCWLAGRRRRRA